MRRPIRGSGKILMVGVLALSLGAAVASPAGAATPAVCTKATFKTNLTTLKSTSALSGCTHGPATAATIVANFAKLTNIQVTITWKSGGGVNGPLKITEKTVTKGNKCKSEKVKGKMVKDTLIVSTGKVAKSTGKASSLNGTTFSESLCVTQKSATYLMAGTTIKI